MTKQKFTILIIILVIIVAIIFGFLYLNQPRGGKDTTGGGDNFFAQFNPFDRKPTPSEPKPTETPETPIFTEETQKLKLRKVSSMPIAGFTVFQKERFKDVPLAILETDLLFENSSAPVKIPTPPPTEFKPNLRYVARATGNIYQTFVDKIDERRFSGTIIPRVHEAYFGNKGEAVVVRYLKTDNLTIATFVGSVPKEFLGSDMTGENEIKGTFLPENIIDMSLSPDALKIFYLFNSGETATGITSGILGENRLQVFDSPFTEWLSWWPNKTMITLTTKPSGGVPGYAYIINPEKKDFAKILGEINGLTILASPSGKLILYSNNTLALSVYNIDTKEITPLGLRTLPEKCVWGKSSEVVYCLVPKFYDPALYPDAWYQGEVSFDDQIWIIDISTGSSRMILDPVMVVGGENIDGIKLALDEAEEYLLFVNKKDSYLWALDLSEE